jgi:hypothetical protein
MTCLQAKRKFNSVPRHYGYTLVIDPPIKHLILGEDIEGIGWVDFNLPKTVIQYWQGWYKHRTDAQRRADELNKA